MEAAVETVVAEPTATFVSEAPIAPANEVQLFGKWSYEGLEVADLSLVVGRVDLFNSCIC